MSRFKILGSGLVVIAMILFWFNQRLVTNKKTAQSPYLKMQMCQNEQEKFLCVNIPEASSQPFGVYQGGKLFHVLADGGAYFKKAKEMLSNDQRSQANVSALATILFLDNFITQVDVKNFEENIFAYRLFERTTSHPALRVSFIFKPKKFTRFKQLIHPDMKLALKRDGAKALKFIEVLYAIEVHK